MSLIKPPIPDDWDPHLVEFVKNHPERAYGALKQRRISDIELEPRVTQCVSSLVRFSHTCVGQIGIMPARKPVLYVPFAETVAKQD